MTQQVEIAVRVLPNGQGLELPRYQTSDSAGMDLMAAIEERVQLKPGERALIPTGLAIGLPSGYEAQIRPRSGLAFKKGVTVVNSPGTIDADYRGEIGIVLINHGDTLVDIGRGDRIAQMIIAPVVQGIWRSVDDLDDTVRGAGGFGHTG
ncbi:MAG: dUTP diphosphatase [Magnetococcales bacterium]|nr:dUTP diphosphatase [Magnetococcales bacterium]